MLSIAILAFSCSAYPMETDSGYDSDSSIESIDLNADPVSDALIYIGNAEIVDALACIKEGELSLDDYARKILKHGDLSIVASSMQALAQFRNLLVILDQGKKEFNAQESEESIPEEKSGKWIRLKIEPPVGKQKIIRHYLSSYFVTRCIAGEKEVDDYLLRKREEYLKKEVCGHTAWGHKGNPYCWHNILKKLQSDREECIEVLRTYINEDKTLGFYPENVQAWLKQEAASFPDDIQRWINSTDE